MGPLNGIKVVELAQIMAGPTCGMLLADMGADVVKVEKLPGGDDTRSYTEPSIAGESAAFMMLNRNKRGIAVNLKTPGGLEVVKRLLADGDVGGPPAKSGTSIADINAGILAALGILAAVIARAKTGRGQVVETSLMEAAVQQTFWQAAMFFATGVNPGPTGSAHILTAPYQ